MLQAEVQRLKVQIRSYQVAAANESNSKGNNEVTIGDRRGGGRAISTLTEDPEIARMRTDIVRLERICKTQVQ